MADVTNTVQLFPALEVDAQIIQALDESTAELADLAGRLLPVLIRASAANKTARAAISAHPLGGLDDLDRWLPGLQLLEDAWMLLDGMTGEWENFNPDWSKFEALRDELEGRMAVCPGGPPGGPAMTSMMRSLGST